VKHGEGNTNSPELSLLKFLPLVYHQSHFLAATLDFTTFFTTGATHFFYSWAVFGLDRIITLMKQSLRKLNTVIQQPAKEQGLINLRGRRGGALAPLG